VVNNARKVRKIEDLRSFEQRVSATNAIVFLVMEFIGEVKSDPARSARRDIGISRGKINTKRRNGHLPVYGCSTDEPG